MSKTSVTKSSFCAITERRQIENVGLNVAIHGTVDTSVLLWTAADTINSGPPDPPANTPEVTPVPGSQGTPQALASWATILHSVTLGTVITLLRRGMWQVELGLTCTGGDVLASRLAAGIAFNPTPAQLLAASNPINTAGPEIKMGQDISVAALLQGGINLAVTLVVSDMDAGANRSVALPTVPRTLRFLATNGAGAVVAATDILEATAKYRVTYTGDVMGR
jgi:hypothetical protein